MTQLLDAYGRPVRRQTLVRDVPQPGVTSVRQAYAGTVASGLTPHRLAKILLSANEGDIHDYLVLAEEMEERDQHYSSVLGIRKRAISGVEPIVKAASDDPKDVDIARAVRENIAEHDGFADLVEDMLDALGKGFSQTEILWRKGKREWWVEEFKHHDPRHFRFDQDTGREVRLLDESDMVNGIALDPFKWISHKAKLKSGLPIRGGLARLVAFGWMCKAYTVKDWMAWVETYGLPLRVGRYGPQATTEDVEVLFRAVANIGTDAAAVLPESMKIDFVNALQGGANERVFESLARWVDEQTSKAVLGQTMTSDNGSSQSQAEVHNEVRHDIAKADARSISGTLNRDLVKPYIDLHFGEQARYPKIKIVIEEAEDLGLILEHTEKMVKAGLRVKASEVRGKLGYSEPETDDEVIGAPTTPDKTEGTETTAQNREEPNVLSDPIDDLIGDALEDWEEVMGPIMEPILEILQVAEDYEDAQAMLTEAFPDMDTGPFIQSLVQNAFKARAEGDVAE